ncbi:hypothetical protein [Sphingobacterium sp. JB170]|uniref:hypothetical protein n=1 Tax=Sphingobacterium sp. JB170 TaxID=1434842 RepID=UPI00097EFF82|nr:hypothetical protein [Sphingobacterium sp. JB170]SJN47910.1 hypothetical protein FM107_16435 [Sphingobacterium sp. JB170]
MKNLKSYVAAIVATASIAGFSAFNVADASNNLANETLYFHGDTTDPSSVEEPSNWTTSSNGQSCSSGDIACSMTVTDQDVTASGELDPTRLEIQAQKNNADEYAPTKLSGDAEPSFHNKQ